MMAKMPSRPPPYGMDDQWSQDKRCDVEPIFLRYCFLHLASSTSGPRARPRRDAEMATRKRTSGEGLNCAWSMIHSAIKAPTSSRALPNLLRPVPRRRLRSATRIGAREAFMSRHIRIHCRRHPR
jgi:hypothetical protein